jgi:hypothetical protein
MRIVKFAPSFSIMRLAYQEYKRKALFGLPSQANNGRTAARARSFVIPVSQFAAFHARSSWADS